MLNTKITGLAMAVSLAFSLTGCVSTSNTNEGSAKIAVGDGNADTVLVKGDFYTVDPSNSQAQAVAVKNGVIVYVGDMDGISAFVGEQTDVIDLEGKFAMPAFVDSHLHPITPSYANLFQAPLFDLTTTDAYLAAITKFAQTAPSNDWIVGGGFEAGVFGSTGPSKDVLDTILPGRAVAIIDRDTHSILVNSKGLELMGITKNTPTDVDGGGQIVKDKNGNPTGLLVDDAAMNLAYAFFPQATKTQYKESLKWMQAWLNREGITTAHDAWVETDPNYYQAFNELAQAGELTVRFRGSWYIDPVGSQMDGTYIEQIDYGFELSEGFKHPHFQVNSFKFLSDGVLGFGSALEIDENGNIVGPEVWQQADMVKAFAKVDKAGFQIHAHAVGDGAIQLTLDAMEAAQIQNGDRDSRHSIAHVELITAADIIRMGNLGVSAHLTTSGFGSEGDYEDLPAMTISNGSKEAPLKSLIDANVNVAIASDYGTSDPAPMESIYGAMTREGSEGTSLEEVLIAITLNGAKANFLEAEIGSLEVGKKADIVVLSKDLFEIKTEDIPSVVIEQTFFEGKKVH